LPEPTSLTSLPEEDEDLTNNRAPNNESDFADSRAMKTESGPAKSLFFDVPKKTECLFKHDYYYTDKIRHKKYCLCDCEWCKKTNKETELPSKVYVP
jgi:hypothetical protein